MIRVLNLDLSKERALLTFLGRSPESVPEIEQNRSIRLVRLWPAQEVEFNIST